MADEEEVDVNRLIQLYQQEKRGGPPVRLSADFHERVRECLARLRRAHEQEQSRDPSSLKTLQLAEQLQKVRTLQTDILNLRLRKLLLLAHQDLTGSAVDTKNLTPEERSLFDDLVRDVSSGRQSMLSGAEARRGTAPAPAAGVRPAPEGPRMAGPAPAAPAPEEAGAPPEGGAGEGLLVPMVIVEDVPDFALGEKGSLSFKKKDVVALPPEVARVLEFHGKGRPVVPVRK